jgi:predicted anti-sigma-YlaC factor YlaD
VNDPHRDGEASVQERPLSGLDSSSASANQLSHQEVRARLSDYLDGSLTAAEKQTVDSHLENCRDCRAFRDTLRQTVHALDSLSPHRVPEATKHRILDRARERKIQDVARGAR